ncbi:hypothetical protein URH17368_1143 [Alicyclobacillus hesperidum URH17-3-68]|uniref:Lipoprotein n=1 Tax=Alicyclobacillus hesperidum TaxID=89784 RepID=A0A1H2W8G9_9BACL|nr:hypothetical protein [Alicyclobacillus hesperidum]EJY56138.1 hypothetical protein URH17368_1143 [Alicyclobacillus hesperidum URH17-3-68]SDW76838.1 hypothetical protein SAMN04489725_1146 [Alicyclobacillus hesperidum]
MNRKQQISMFGITAVAILALAGCGTSANSTSGNSTNGGAASTTVSSAKHTTSGDKATSAKKSAAAKSTTKKATTKGTVATSNQSKSDSVHAANTITVTSPKAEQMVAPGQTLTVTGTVANGFTQKDVQVTLFDGTAHGSKTLVTRIFQAGKNDAWSGTIAVPKSLPKSSTELALDAEVLVKGGPRVQTVLKVK